MTSPSKFLSLCAALTLSVAALYGCTGSQASAETAQGAKASPVADMPYVADDVEMAVMLHDDATEAPAADEVVEVIDEATGEAIQMTAAEAKASGREVVARPNAGAQAPAQSQQAPAASAHTHNFQFVPTKAAWDEVTYKTVERCICNGCGADITGMTAAHAQAAGFGSNCGGWHSVAQSVPSGTIHHDAQGYYACSCGATK